MIVMNDDVKFLDDLRTEVVVWMGNDVSIKKMCNMAGVSRNTLEKVRRGAGATIGSTVRLLRVMGKKLKIVDNEGE